MTNIWEFNALWPLCMAFGLKKGHSLYVVNQFSETEFVTFYLDHAVPTPAFHPLYSTLLVQGWVTLTVQDKLVVGTIHH